MRANQLRFWFASFDYVLIEALGRIGLRLTPFANPACGTIRLKPLKIGAQVRVSVRRIKIAMLAAPRRPPRSSLGARPAACPCQTERHLTYPYVKRATF
jgi:Transposase DDE domain group 1